jgi:hypothetical protein
VGTGALQNTSTNWPCVYGNWYSNEKYQILYTAADLAAAGITPGKISSIAFDVASLPAGMNNTFLNYTIKMACTSVADLDPTGLGWSIPFVTPVTQVVWGPQNYTAVAGWNTHNLTTVWEWDGVSNLLVEICYDWVGPSNYTTNAIMNQTVTPYRSFLVYYSDGIVACPELLANSSYTQRPNTRFTTCQSVATPADFTYSWSPNTGVTGTPPTVTLAPTVTTTYSVSITSNFGGCVKVDTFPITVINPFTFNMPASATYCPGDPAATISASTTPAAVTATWSGPGMTDLGNGTSGSFSPAGAGTGSWYVYYTASAAGCTATDSVQQIVSPTAMPIAVTMPASSTYCPLDPAATITASSTPAAVTGTWSGLGMTN